MKKAFYLVLIFLLIALLGGCENKTLRPESNVGINVNEIHYFDVGAELHPDGNLISSLFVNGEITCQTKGDKLVFDPLGYQQGEIVLIEKLVCNEDIAEDHIYEIEREFVGRYIIIREED